jgi:mannosyltransferase
MNRAYARAVGILSLTLLLAFAIRALWLDSQPLWRDEVDALRFASAAWPELRASFTRMGFNGPFYHLLLRGWVGLAGESETALRFFSLWWGVLGVALTYALGGRLFGRRAGLIAALLSALSPYLVWYSQEAKMYTLVPALVLLALAGLHRALSGGGWRWWAVTAVATSLAFYSHILAALLIPLHVALFLVWWRRARTRWRGALISLACLTLPYLPLLAWQWRLVAQPRETGFPRYGLGPMALVLLNAWSLGTARLGVPTEQLAAGLMAAAGAWGLCSPALVRTGGGIGDRAAVRAACADRAAVLIWLALPVLSVALISTWQPIFTDRYLIWSAPALYLLVGAGLDVLARRGWTLRWLGGLLVGAILVFDTLALHQQVSVPLKSDVRAAAAYVAANVAVQYPPQSARPHRVYLPLVVAGGSAPARAGTLILFQIPYIRYTFDYYYPVKDYAWAEGPYTNARTADGGYATDTGQVAAYLREVTAPYQSVWLVLSEAEMWDERGLTLAWLEANAQRVDEAHFTRVDVYRYVLPGAP